MKLYARENFCVNEINFKHGATPTADASRGRNDGGTCRKKGVKCVGSVAVGGCWQRVYFLKIKMPSLWVLKCCSPPSAFCSSYRCFFFLFRLFVLQLHFWLCVLSWLLLNIFVYTYYMPFMCLFLECLFGFIFMISCIFKCLKVYFIFVCLLASLSLSFCFSCSSSFSALWISKWCDRRFAYSNVFGWFSCLSWCWVVSNETWRLQGVKWNRFRLASFSRMKLDTKSQHFPLMKIDLWFTSWFRLIRS